jgi:hypothetical protein
VPTSIPAARQRAVHRGSDDRRRNCRGRGQWLRQTEIQNSHTGLREHDIARLEIAIHDAAAVGLVERVRDLRTVLQPLVRGQRTFAHAVAKRFPFKAQSLSIMLGDLVQHADMTVRQLRNSASRALESFSEPEKGARVGS